MSTSMGKVYFQVSLGSWWDKNKEILRRNFLRILFDKNFNSQSKKLHDNRQKHKSIVNLTFKMFSPVFT